jgi:hypothetical protein
MADVAYTLAQLVRDNPRYLLEGTTLTLNTGPVQEPGAAPRLFHAVFIGQSNRRGAEAWPAVSSTALAIMLLRGMQTWYSDDNPEDPEARADSDFLFTSAAESVVETAASGLIDALKAALLEAGGHANDQVLVTNVAQDGRFLSEYGPLNDDTRGTPVGQWATVLDDITRVHAQATLAGYTYVFLGLFPDGLEAEANDFGSGGVDDYRALYNGTLLTASQVIAAVSLEITDMADELDTYVKLINPAFEGRVFIRPASFPLSHSIARAAADASSLVRVSVPRYAMVSAINASNLTGASQYWGDWIHLNPDGQQQRGRLEAMEAAAVLVGDSTRDAVHPVSAAKVDATHIDVTFAGNLGPLVVDTTSIMQLEGWGFVTCSGAFDSLAASAFATGAVVQSDNVIRLTVPSVPSPCHVRIGHQSRLALAAFGPVTDFVADAGDSPDGFQLESVAVAGDLTGTLANIIREGTFYLYKADLSKRMTVRSVTYDSGTNKTVFTGEARHSTGADFAVADTLRIYRISQGSNVRDSVTVDCGGEFMFGPREGEPYDGHRWTELSWGIPVTGS